MFLSAGHPFCAHHKARWNQSEKTVKSKQTRDDETEENHQLRKLRNLSKSSADLDW